MRTACIVASIVWLLVAMAASAEAPSPLPAGSDYGAGLTLRETTAISDVVRAPEEFAGEPVLLHGRVSDVCQRKGCWLVLRDGGEHLRVRFADYGFFVPADASGSEAYVEGHVKVEVLSEKSARHYAAESIDGDPAAISGPQREVGFTATGVRLIPAP
jgi:hypothetical protein